MASFLPTQEPGPGPTDAPLPTYQSYSAYTTSVYQQTLTLTRIAYDPQATAAPSADIQTITQLTTSIGYSVVNIPLLYDGPLPPPPLGTLFTTANQRVIQPTPTSTAQQSQPTSTSGQTGQGGSNEGGGQSSGGGDTNGVGNGGGTSGGSTSNGNSGGSGANGGNGSGSSGQGNGGSGSANGGNASSGNGGGSGGGSAEGNGGSGNGGGNGVGQGASGNGSGNQGSQGGTTSPPATPNPTVAASSASLASIAAGSAAASASLASVAASNAAESSAASLASVSAASQASAASAASISAAVSGSSQVSNPLSPTPTQTSGGGGGGLPPTSDFARNGLSGGQIAGIVLGVLAAVLLALLCLLCAARRRRRRRKEQAAAGLTGGSSILASRGSRRWRPAFGRVSGGGAQRGTYAALGAAGAGAGAVANRDSIRSDEWEEDQLGSHGSGFFVVGGKQSQADPFHDDAAEGDHAQQYGNLAPSGTPGSERKKGALAAGGVAAIGAGLAAVFAGKSGKPSGKGKGKERLIDSTSSSGHHPDASFADEDLNGERKGLMNFVDADNTADMTAAGDLSEMREAGGADRWSAPVSYDPYRSSTGVGVAAAGTAAAASYYVASPRQTDEQDQQGRESALSPSAPTYAGWTRYSDSVTGGPPSSAAVTGGPGEPSVVASSSGSTSNANAPSSHSTKESLYTTLGAFPRIEEHEKSGKEHDADDDVQTYGNVAPSSKHWTQDMQHRSAADSYRGLAGLGDDPEEHRKLALAAAAATVAAGGSGLGLGALAAHHRQSSAGEGNAGQDQRHSTLEPRNSRFISRDTPLLGPGFEEGQGKDQAIDSGEQERFESMLPTFTSSHGRTDSYGPHGRLSTIQSVGEFGERGSSSGGGGAGGGAGSGGMTGSSAQQSSGSSDAAKLHAAHAFGRRPASSTNTLGAVTAEESPRPDSAGNPLTAIDGESSNQQHIGHNSGELVAGAAGGAGLLGSLAFGWRRLTGSGPSSTTTGGADMQREDSRDAEAAAMDQDSVNVHHREPHARQRSRGDPGMAAEVQSQRASVITATNHGHDSGNGLGASSSSGGENRRSPSGSGQSQSSQRPTAGRETMTIDEEAGENERRSSQVIYREEMEEDNGNVADDEDPIGDSSGAMATIATTRDGLPTNASVAQTRTSSDNPYDVVGRTATSPTGETSTRALRDAISEETGAMDTAISRAGDSESYTTSPQRASDSASMNSSSLASRQRLAARHASSGASTGGASYSPSHLVRQTSGVAATTNSSSMSSSRGARGGGARGGGRGRGGSGSEYTSSNSRNNRSYGGGGDSASRRDTSTLESDGQSSRATAGGAQDEARRISMDQSSLARVHEQHGEYDDDTSPYVVDAPGTATSSFYPSESLGAAVRRRAEQDAARDQQRERTDSMATSADQTITPRVIPMALRVGAAGPTTAASNVGSGSGSGATSSGTTAIVPPAEGIAASSSSQWRQSPRVQTASQRAMQAAASMEQKDPDLEAGREGNEEDKSNERRNGNANDNDNDDEDAKRKSVWPKFLRR